VIKYRHVSKKLVLKVTDDVVLVKFKTDQLSDVKRIDRLNALLVSMMAAPTIQEAEVLARESDHPSQQQQHTRTD
jgi:signal recognition particle subunit SRP9